MPFVTVFYERIAFSFNDYRLVVSLLSKVWKASLTYEKKLFIIKISSQEISYVIKIALRRRANVSLSGRSLCNISHSIYRTSLAQLIDKIRESCRSGVSGVTNITESYRLTITMGETRDAIDCLL